MYIEQNPKRNKYFLGNMQKLTNDYQSRNWIGNARNIQHHQSNLLLHEFPEPTLLRLPAGWDDEWVILGLTPH